MDFLKKVTGQKSLVEAKMLFEKGNFEKAKQKLLSIDGYELTENADASFLLAKIFIQEGSNNHKKIVKCLSDAMSFNHKEAKELYYQYYDGYGNLKGNKKYESINTSDLDTEEFKTKYRHEYEVNTFSKEIRNRELAYFSKFINQYKSLHQGSDITSTTLNRIHKVFPYVKKEDIIFYKDTSTIVVDNWVAFTANHLYQANGGHTNIVDIVDGKVYCHNLIDGDKLLLFHEDGTTTITSFLAYDKEFMELVKLTKDFIPYLKARANEFYNNKAYEKSYLLYLENAVKYNNCDAQKKLGLFYKKGLFVQKDLERAKYWETLASRQERLINENKNVQSRISQDRTDILKVMQKYAAKFKLQSGKELSTDKVQTYIKKKGLKFSPNDILYGKLEDIQSSFSDKWLITRNNIYFDEWYCNLKLDNAKLKYAFKNDTGGFTICYQDGKFTTHSIYKDNIKYLGDIVNFINDVSFALHGVDYSKRMRKYNLRDLYKTLYKGYHFDKYEEKEKKELWKMITKLNLNSYNIARPEDILGAKCFSKGNKNIIIFGNEYAIYVIGDHITVIDYFALKKVTFDSKTFTIHYFDGSTQTIEHCNNDKDAFRIANTLNRFANIVHKDKLSVNGRTMITNENVDFYFIKYTTWKELPEDMEELERMYLGYTSTPGDDPYYDSEALKYISSNYNRKADERNPQYITHENVDYKFKKYVPGNEPDDFDALEKMYYGYGMMPKGHMNQIGEDELQRIKEFMLRADSEDKYLQEQSDFGLVSAKCKLKAKRISNYKNLSSIVSEIWYGIIMDHNNKAKEPYESEWRIINGKREIIKIFWFEEMMNTLKARAKKEMGTSENPVAYAAYQVFNPTLNELEKSRFATYEGKPISEVLGKSPSASAVMKLFNIPTHQFYGAMSGINPYARIFFHSLQDMQEVTTKTEYLPVSSVIEDYSLDDLKYMANTKHLMESEYKTTGKVDGDSHGAQMIRQFNDDRRIETVTKGEWFSSFLRYTDAHTKPQEMSYIDSSDASRSPDPRFYGSYHGAWEQGKINRAKKYLSIYEEMSDNGYLLFTCFLCEKGETEYRGIYFDRKQEQYAKLRQRIDLKYKTKK